MAGGDQHKPAKSRHPELVSGPISRFARSKRWQSQAHRQIRPMRVLAFDEVDFPLPMPALQLLLPQDRLFHIAELLEADEHVNAVFRSESGQSVVTVLPQASEEVRGDADVKGAVRLAGEDIDARVALDGHGTEFAARWVLKQVQDDEKGEKDCIDAPSPPTKPVTLNSFQGPFRGLPGALNRKLRRDVSFNHDKAGQAAQWALKRVQGDDIRKAGLL